jgi:hypothetical protein
MANSGKASEDTRILSTSNGIGIAAIGNVCAVIWREGVIESRFEKQRAALAEVVDRYPGKAGFMCIIEPTAHPPDEKLRKASTDMVASHGDRLKCVAGVIEGNGFRAAVTRSALSTITLFITNRKAPISYFSNTTAAVRWMTGYMLINSSVHLIAEVERLRGMLAPFDGKWGSGDTAGQRAL